MEPLATAFILAIFVQLLTGRAKKFITDKQTEILALAIGVALCVVYQAGILAMLGLQAAFQYGEYLDYVLTGVAISGGASVITDLAKQLGQLATTKRPPGVS